MNHLVIPLLMVVKNCSLRCAVFCRGRHRGSGLPDSCNLHNLEVSVWRRLIPLGCGNDIDQTDVSGTFHIIFAISFVVEVGNKE